MSAQTLRFWREVEPTPGPVALRFGNYRPLVKLRFDRPVQPTPGPVNLVFGAYIPPAFDTITATLAATLPPADLPGLTLVAEGVQAEPLAITVAATLPDVDISYMVLTADFVQLLDLPDADGVGIRDRSARQPTTHVGLAVRAQDMIRTPTPLAAHQQQAIPLSVPLGAPQRQMLASRHAAHVPHTHGLPLSAHTRPRHAEAVRTHRHNTSRHQHGIAIATGTRPRHAEYIRLRRRADVVEQQACPTASGARIGHHHGLKTATRLSVRQQQMIPLPVGWWQATYPWPPPWVDPNQPTGPVALRFCRLADGTTRLVFGCPLPQGAIVVPTRRTYIVINDVSLTRVSNNTPIAARSLQVQIDAGTWGWGWSASVPAAHLADIERDSPDEPVELEANINGVLWRLLVERVSQERSFAQNTLSIAGRGIAAHIAAPYYPAQSRTNAGALTAQQLADAALTINGVPLGWTLDWQIPDWLVPAGAWVHTGPPMDAVQTIAQAAGGYVQADRVQKILHVLPAYPLLPWQWAGATPAFTLPAAVTTREATDFIQLPDYNRVFVSGTDIGGVLGQVTRAGTAGDLPAEMVVDPLITHADAARGRGAAILGNTGHQQRLTLQTPLLPNIGLYPVGSLIQWQDGAATRRGLVRSVSVSAAMPRVRQQIEVECHG